MRLFDIILIILAIGGLFTVFAGMTTDKHMIDFYDKNHPELNLSGRSGIITAENSTYDLLSQAVLGEATNANKNLSSIQDDLGEASNTEMGLLSIPGAVLRAMKAVFNVFSLKWMNTIQSALETMFGLEAGSLVIFAVISKIVLWILIALFVGAVLRWLV